MKKRSRDLVRQITGKRGSGAAPMYLDRDAIARRVREAPDSAGKGWEQSMNFTKQTPASPFRLRRLAAVLVAAALVLGVGVSAAAVSGVITSVVGHSSSRPEYTALPTAERCMADAGYVPALPEAFSNGFAFRRGRLVEESLVDEGGVVAEEYISFSFEYEKDGETVLLDQARYASDTGTPLHSQTLDCGGVTAYYHAGTHKLVPLDYVPTPEEEAAREAGALGFGYTDITPDRIETNAVQTLSWQTGDLHCSLFQMNGSLTPEELAQMAEEILAAAE